MKTSCGSGRRSAAYLEGKDDRMKHDRKLIKGLSQNSLETNQWENLQKIVLRLY